ncbi:unnamed protein product [Mucor hiemalis]
MSLTLARSTLRARPLCLGYRPYLTLVQPVKPFIRTLIQPSATRAFSTTYIRFNNEQLNNTKTTVVTPTEKTQEVATTKAAPTSRIGKFIQHSKDLIKFYKDGLKLLWNNNKQAKALLLRVKNEGYELN